MVIHEVRKNDSIYKISKDYMVSAEQIQDANGFKKADNLVIGQSLIIPGIDRYVVKNGDTMFKIAKAYDISLYGLIQMNPQLSNHDDLSVGQVLRVPHRVPKDRIIVNGYSYPFADLGVLDEALPYLSYLSVFSYEARPDGSLKPMADQAVLEESKDYGVAPRMVISNISEKTGLFDSQLAHDILSNERAVNKLINSALQIMKEKKYVGVDLDFENLYPADRELYNQFLKKISDALHKSGYTLSAAIEKKVNANNTVNAAHDYKVHGIYDDLVILMTYDWGYVLGPPRAVSPANEVEKVLQYAVTEIPSKKILMGIPNYAYDWTLPYKEGTKARLLSHVDAAELAWKEHAEIKYDPISECPYFYYYDSNGKEHVVWFEDARSIQAKMDLVKKYNLGGISYWTVNKSFPQNWSVLSSTFQIEKY